MAAADSRAPVVWLLQDDRPGHVSQLRGLGNRLRVLAGADISSIDATGIKVPLWRTLLGVAPAVDAPQQQPDLIIAAGHGTHRLLLALRRKRKARTVVLMKPGFPLGWVDAAIIPAHDNPPEDRKNILVTEGVINAITPMAKITDKPEALILVGGPSDHYQWEDDVVIGQMTELMGHYRDWRWTISASRRTPDSLVSRLNELASLKVTVVDHTRTHENWLAHQLSASRAAWVTPDSASMVCEAATSGVPTGVFELPARPRSRVASGTSRLLEKGHVASWSNHATVMTGRIPESGRLWEADRAARWLIRNLLPGARP
jgi:mitochondrial fission protein ELM1